MSKNNKTPLEQDVFQILDQINCSKHVSTLLYKDTMLKQKIKLSLFSEHTKTKFV